MDLGVPADPTPTNKHLGVGVLGVQGTTILLLTTALPLLNSNSFSSKCSGSKEVGCLLKGSNHLRCLLEVLEDQVARTTLATPSRLSRTCCGLGREDPNPNLLAIREVVAGSNPHSPLPLEVRVVSLLKDQAVCDPQWVGVKANPKCNLNNPSATCRAEGG